MAGSDALFSGAVSEVYDRLMVPMIFEPYARDLVRRIDAQASYDILEHAAGTGALTRALAASLPDHARIVATDLNQPMIDLAAARQADDRRISWRRADALALPFEEERFDIVLCQFGAMFFPDKIQAYKEARRVLKPAGKYLFNVWDRIAENELADVVTQALTQLFPHDPPLFMARTPHGYHDLARIDAELTAAGFKEILIDSVECRSVAACARDAAVAYCQGTLLRDEIAARHGSLNDATDSAAAALSDRFGTGQISARMRAFVVTAIR